MKTLTEQFEEILKPFQGRLTKQEVEDMQQAFWIVVKERDNYVIGELESVDIDPRSGDIYRLEGANNAKIAIKKRMEKSL